MLDMLKVNNKDIVLVFLSLTLNTGDLEHLNTHWVREPVQKYLSVKTCIIWKTVLVSIWYEFLLRGIFEQTVIGLVPTFNVSLNRVKNKISKQVQLIPVKATDRRC